MHCALLVVLLQVPNEHRDRVNNRLALIVDLDRAVKTTIKVTPKVLFMMRLSFEGLPFGIHEALRSEDPLMSILALKATPHSDDRTLIQANREVVDSLYDMCPFLHLNIPRGTWEDAVDDQAACCLLQNIPRLWHSDVEYVSIHELSLWVYDGIMKPDVNKHVGVAALALWNTTNQLRIKRHPTAKPREYFLQDFGNLGKVYAIVWMLLYNIPQELCSTTLSAMCAIAGI